MKQWLRRLRGVLGIGTLWGVAGTALGTVAGLIVSVSGGLPLLDTLVEFGLGAGGLGFVLGSGFAGVLTMLERRRTLDELSPGRAALWGGMAGAAAALVVGISLLPELGAILSVRQLVLLFVAAPGSYGALSAALAAGTVALARRAPAELDSGPTCDEEGLLGAPIDG